MWQHETLCCVLVLTVSQWNTNLWCRRETNTSCFSSVESETTWGKPLTAFGHEILLHSADEILMRQATFIAVSVLREIKSVNVRSSIRVRGRLSKCSQDE